MGGIKLQIADQKEWCKMAFRKKSSIRLGNKGLDPFYEASIAKWKHTERLVAGQRGFKERKEN